MSNVDNLLREYLIQKGYTKTAAEFSQETLKPGMSRSLEGNRGGSAIDKSTQKLLHTISEELLSTAVTEGNATPYSTGYSTFRNWALGSIDLVRPQLLAMCFPLFIYCYLSIVKTGSKNDAQVTRFVDLWDLSWTMDLLVLLPILPILAWTYLYFLVICRVSFGNGAAIT
jgi:hypothetical protein